MDIEIFNQLEKILINEKEPSVAISDMMKTEKFNKSDFSIIRKLEDIPQEKKYHPEGNVWNHTKMVVDMGAKIKNLSDDARSFMWATLLHDIGKIPTTKFIKGRYRSYNHDTEGAEMVYKLLNKYGYTELTEDVGELVRYHMHHIYIIKNLPFSNIEGLLSSKKFNDIILLFICDKLGRGNQDINEYKHSLGEVFLILDKLEKESNIKYYELRNKIKEFEKSIYKE
jgi:putative nucleotidyltransferase with HDIG domain